MAYKKSSTPVVLTQEQCDWARDTLLARHAARLGAGEMRRLGEDLAHASRGLSGCYWWDREAAEFLFAGPFLGRTSDSSYYFLVDDELLHVVDLGGWLGPCRLSFQKFSSGLEGRRSEFERRLTAVLQKSGLASALNDEPWCALAPEHQALAMPQFVADDQRTVDNL